MGRQHTICRSSEAARRSASWARASRDDEGLPSPRHSTSGVRSDEGKASSSDSRSISGREECEWNGRDEVKEEECGRIVSRIQSVGVSSSDVLLRRTDRDGDSVVGLFLRFFRVRAGVK